MMASIVVSVRTASMLASRHTLSGRSTVTTFLPRRSQLVARALLR